MEKEQCFHIGRREFLGLAIFNYNIICFAITERVDDRSTDRQPHSLIFNFSTIRGQWVSLFAY